MSKPTISYGHAKADHFSYDMYEEGWTGACDAGTNSTTIVDATLAGFGNDYFNGCYIKLTSGTYIDEERAVSAYVSATGTFTVAAFTGAPSVADTFDLSWWSKIEDGQTLGPMSLQNDSIYRITASGSAGNKIGYFENKFDDWDFSTTTYTKIRFRYRTSDNSVKAKIVVCYPGDGQTVLDQTSSTKWKTGSITLTSAKSVQYLRLHCDAAIGWVEYDFYMIYQADFTIPNTRFGAEIDPKNREVFLKPPGAIGAATQNFGNELAEVTLKCDLDIGTWKRTGDVVVGEVFMEILHKSVSEAWQWLDLGELKVKMCVTLAQPTINAVGGDPDSTRQITLRFTEYRDVPADEETYDERFGLNS